MTKTEKMLDKKEILYDCIIVIVNYYNIIMKKRNKDNERKLLVTRVFAPVRHQTVINLRNAITTGIFKPGESLIERELCELTGVSRTSVREALRQLEAEGLIKLIPPKGPTVATITPDEAREIYEVRQVLEGLACRLFAERADSSQMKALARTLDRLEKVSSGGQTKDVISAKDDFYNVILEGCGNKTIHSLIKTLHARINLLRSTSLSQPGRPLKAFEEIRCIVEAIERRESDSAFNACVDHVLNAECVALEILGRSHYGSKS